MKSKTKPKGATTYKETTFGIIPRSKLFKLELEGTRRGIEYIYNIVQNQSYFKIDSDLICKLHQIAFGWIFPKLNGQVNIVIFKLLFQIKKHHCITRCQS